MNERLIQARESIEEAELLYKEEMGNKLVLTKLYHAMIYGLFALFGITDIRDLTHADIIERFEKEYVKKGLFNNEFLSVIRHAYELTHECDCDHMPVPADEDIESTMYEAKEFINEMDNYLQMNEN